MSRMTRFAGTVILMLFGSRWNRLYPYLRSLFPERLALYLFNGLCAGLSRVCWPCYR